MVDPQGNDPGGQNPNLMAREGKGIIEDAQLQDERRILDGFHIDPVQGLGDLPGADAHEAQQDPQHRCNQDAAQSTFHCNGKALDKIRFVGQDHRPGSF